MQIIESTDFGVRSAVYGVRRRFAPLQIDLYPMLHVGRPEYYEEVRRRLREADIVVCEGIHSDSASLPPEPGKEPEPGTAESPPRIRDLLREPERLLRDPGRRADLLVALLTAGYEVIPDDDQHGLIVQPDLTDGLDAQVICPDVSAQELSERVKTISPLRRTAALAALGTAAVAQRLVGPRMTRCQLRHSALDDEPSVAEIMTPEAVEHFARVLVDERDEPLLALLDELIEQHGRDELRVAVVYGAQHLRAVINHLYAKGFRVSTSDWLTVTPWV